MENEGVSLEGKIPGAMLVSGFIRKNVDRRVVDLADGTLVDKIEKRLQDTTPLQH